MFEMLGNWSFGDYFKEEAISWAWELLTKIYKIDAACLYVSVFEGSTDADALSRDDEAYNIWRKIVPEARIIMGDKKDNFWEMGDQGPCGPCSEIHVDLRTKEEKEKVPVHNWSMRTILWSWKFGTWSLCSITAWQMGNWSRSRKNMWIPEWVLKGFVWPCKT